MPHGAATAAPEPAATAEAGATTTAAAAGAAAAAAPRGGRALMAQERLAELQQQLPHMVTDSDTDSEFAGACSIRACHDEGRAVRLCLPLACALSRALPRAACFHMRLLAGVPLDVAGVEAPEPPLRLAPGGATAAGAAAPSGEEEQQQQQVEQGGDTDDESGTFMFRGADDTGRTRVTRDERSEEEDGSLLGGGGDGTDDDSLDGMPAVVAGLSDSDGDA